MLKLYLDTSVAKKAKVNLSKNGTVIAEIETSSPLVSIKEILEKTGAKLEEIDEFSVFPGPGSYTGLRVGAAVINTLNWVFQKKVKPSEPIYK